MNRVIVVSVVLVVGYAVGRFCHHVPVSAESGGGNQHQTSCDQEHTLYGLDSNGDSGIDISDGIHLFTWLFGAGPGPQTCLADPAQLKTCETDLALALSQVVTLQAQLASLQDQLHATESQLFQCNPCLATTDRYIDYGNGTVLDCRTRLAWQKVVEVEKFWLQAGPYCDGLVLSGRGNWRLPTVHELLNMDSSDPSFPFVDSVGEPHWSSTTCGFNNDRAEYVLFGGPEVTVVFKETGGNLAIRAVRCGPE